MMEQNNQQANLLYAGPAPRLLMIHHQIIQAVGDLLTGNLLPNYLCPHRL